MAFIGTILKEVLDNSSSKKRIGYFESKLQVKTLKKLLKQAKNTKFGIDNKFSEILNSNNLIESFQKNVPIYNYESMYKAYWVKTIEGASDVTWPGRIKYFALTSGTSEAASKKIPVSKAMIKYIRKVSLIQTMTLSKYNLKPSFFQKSVLMLGGSTKLTKIGKGFEGDLSGILAGNLPAWFKNFYKPGAKISQIKDWNEKLEILAEKAPQWDVAACAGVPSWYQILFKKIIEKNNLNTIHDIWPDFAFFTHGGVSFEPYKSSFEKLLGKKIHYLETYLASEGFFAIQTDESKKMQLVTGNGVFYEFIPFNEDNFDSDGNILQDPVVLDINHVEENIDYALLVSTCAGAWRYIIGDTIRFVDKSDNQIVITGRVKHFISLCGEHLSVENMNSAIRLTGEELGISIYEYTITGLPHDNLFSHKWYLGVDDIDSLDNISIANILDKHLSILNDDYAVERKAALKEVFVDIIPVQWFYDWMKIHNKEGGQNKFPRVLKTNQITEWEKFIHNKRMEK
ncbi:MAG: GH3 auxin-responsive promoter family protein [Saprospiraceae bacterium]